MCAKVACMRFRLLGLPCLVRAPSVFDVLGTKVVVMHVSFKGKKFLGCLAWLALPGLL